MGSNGYVNILIWQKSAHPSAHIGENRPTLLHTLGKIDHPTNAQGHHRVLCAGEGQQAAGEGQRTRLHQLLLATTRHQQRLSRPALTTVVQFLTQPVAFNNNNYNNRLFVGNILTVVHAKKLKSQKR